MTRPGAEHFIEQAEACDRLGSPFTAGLCRLLAGRLDTGTEMGRRLLDWPGDTKSDLPAIRACGALHALARSGKEPQLTAVYPPAAFDAEPVWAAVRGAIARRDAELALWLDSPPQTNEVARSAVIVGGALWAARLTGLPLALLEIGASAGLNLGFDGYCYDLGNGLAWGQAGSPLTITSEWRGDQPPLDQPLRVVSRAGCDRNPVDPASAADRARLTSYVWADQVQRLARLTTALDLTAASGVRVDKADAADWAEQHLSRVPQAGACRFLFHSVVWQYLPANTAARIEETLNRVGAEATPDAPLVRFGYEGDGKTNSAVLTLTVWPDKRVMPLGRADFHGRWVDWQLPAVQK